MNRLVFSKANYLALKQRLLANDPDLDDQTLADTLEGLTDFTEVVAAIVRSAVTDEALADGLQGLVGQMQARLCRFEERAHKRRQMARDVMVEAQIKKITAPDLTISLRPGSPALLVINEGAIPQSYWIPREPRLNRQGLIADLKRNVVIAGAALSNAEPVLSVRAK